MKFAIIVCISFGFGCASKQLKPEVSNPHRVSWSCDGKVESLNEQEYQLFLKILSKNRNRMCASIEM